MVNVDGKNYYSKEELEGQGLVESEHVILVCDRGWILEGQMAEPYKLTNAHVVRTWNNGLGIGGLQTAEHKDDYTLDALPGGADVSPSAVLFVLPITEW